MTKWIYRAVGTVGVAAGGALLLAGAAAQADGIDPSANDLRGSLDGFFTPLGDSPDGGGDLFGANGGAPTRTAAPGQALGFLGAVPLDPTAGVDPAALEAGPSADAGPLSGSDLTLFGLGDKKLGTNTVGDAVSSVGPLTEDPAGAMGGDQLLSGNAQTGPPAPLLGGNPLGDDDPLSAVGGDSFRSLDGALGNDPLGLGLDKAAGGQSAGSLTGALGEDQLTDTLSDDNLNSIGSDSQMRTLGSTVGADQLSGFGAGGLDSLGGGAGGNGLDSLGGSSLDSLGREAGLGDLGRGGVGGGALGELTSDPLAAVGKHAAPDADDFGVADLKGGDLDQLGGSLVPPLIGNALEAQMRPGFLGGLSEGDSGAALPIVGALPLSGLSTTGNDAGDPLADLAVLNTLDSFGGGGGAPPPGALSPASPPPSSSQSPSSSPSSSSAAASPSSAAPARQPSVSPSPDNSGNHQGGGHRQFSRSSSERPVDGEDREYA